MSLVMPSVDLSKELGKLPIGATEPTVKSIFLPPLLEALGFNQLERYSEYKTGKGNDSVDFAARKNTQSNIFLNSPSNPSLLIEVKGRKTQGGVPINLEEGTPKYLEARSQLQRYLLAPNCSKTQWGIITNSIYIQLFRKHGKIVVPATSNFYITQDNINEVVEKIKSHIDNPPQALKVCIYNCKGGIGKTTTTVNLAGALSKLGKKVLVVDFDANQRDLTHILNIQDKQPSLFDCMLDRDKDINKAIHTFISTHKNGKDSPFDAIAADPIMSRKTDVELIHLIQGGKARLQDILSSFVYKYDYIFIDSSPHWGFFSQSSIYAADAVLIPTRANDVRSLENAAIAISELLPEIKELRQDGGPIPLPIFFNGPLATDVQVEVAKDRLREIATRVEKNSNFNLMPHFFPKYSNAKKNYDIFSLRGNASVTKGAFLGILATFMNKTVADHYQGLVKEYFLP